MLSELNLLLNNSCNLACTYCHFTANRCYPPMEMSRTMLLDRINWFFSQLPDDIQSPALLCFNADGEAFMSRQLLFAGITAAHRLRSQNGRDNLVLALVTNAALIDREAARFLAEHRVSVTVSIDGPPAVTNRHRRDTAGKPAAQAINAGISFLKEAGIPLLVRATVTPQTLDSLYSSFRYLNSLEPASPVKLRPVRSGCDAFAFGWIDAFTDSYIKLAKRLLNEDLPVSALPDDIFHMMRFLLEGTKRFPWCAAGDSMLWVRPDGAICACGLYTGTGSIQQPRNRWDEWRSETGIKRFREEASNLPDSCLSCRWLGACAGGCPAYPAASTGGHRPLCRLYRELGELCSQHLAGRT